MNPAESRILANGIEHHVITWGREGATVVLCHGYLDLAWSFRPLAEELVSAGYRVVAFDFRGHGESSWVGQGGYYHFPDYVLDMHELLPQVSTGRAHLVGHSMGGSACAIYAGTHPGTLASLSLIEGIGPPAQNADIAPTQFEAFLRTVEKRRRRPPASVESLEAARKRMRVQNPDLDDELGLFLAEKGTVVGPDGRRVFRFDPLHQTTSPTPFQLEAFKAMLRKIDVPTLLVAGERGLRVEDEAERDRCIANSRRIEITGVGHMVHWFAPKGLAQALDGFFSECVSMT